jgi:hypothetical protein
MTLSGIEPEVLRPEDRHLIATCFSLHLFFDIEDGGDMFLRNVGWLSTAYSALYPRDRTLHNHRSENLKSYTDFHKILYWGALQKFLGPIKFRLKWNTTTETLYEDLYKFLSTARNKLVTYLSKGRISRTNAVEKKEAHIFVFCTSCGFR